MHELSLFAHQNRRCHSDTVLGPGAHPLDFTAVAGTKHIVIPPASASPRAGFSSLVPMAAMMVRDLEGDPEGERFISRWAPELTFLFPALRERAACRDAAPLVEIAVPPSRRRLHKESEQIFRVTQALVHLVLRWAAGNAPRGLHIHFERLHETDEHTLRLFLRLCSALPLFAQIWVTADARVDDGPAAAGPGGVLGSHLPGRSVLRAAALHRAFIGFEPLPTSDWRDAGVGAAIQPPEPSLGDTAEARTLITLEAALQGEDVDVLGHALLAAVECSIFTQNHDLAHDLLERAAVVFDRLAAHDQRELLLHAGFMLAFTMRFEGALAAVRESLRFAGDGLQRGECLFFAGLLLVKRLGRTSEGREVLHQALAVLSADDSAAAHCERAWVHNILALSYVNDKNLAQARAHCRQALEYTKSAPRSADAIHIKINVISNLTVLDEYGRDLDAALQRWSFFEPMLGRASSVFRKHYLFRKAGLLVKAGRLEEALPCLQECHRLATQATDTFYGDVIARGIAAVHWHLGRPEEAANWYCASLQAKHHLLDGEVAEVSFALARCLVRSGAVMDLESVLQACDAASWSAPLPETKLNRPFTFTNLH
jgi:tetratricopeptide (TPR) repeat protein